MEYACYIFILMSITAGIVASLNITFGYGGLPILGQFAFPLIGAYAMALISVKIGLAPGWGLAGALVAGAVAASSFVVFGVGLRGQNAALGTVALALLVPIIINNWMSLTNGPFGIGGIPSVFSAGDLPPLGASAVVAGLYCGLSIWAQAIFRKSQLGRLVVGSRDSEGLLPFLGESPGVVRSIAVFISGAWAALGGAIYASAVSYVSPNSYTFNDSLFFVAMLFLGGRATLWGPVAGVVVVTSTFEVLRFLGLPGSVSAQVQAIVLGAVLIAVVLFRPHGLLGRPLLK
jgi:branched-chain amino acid transport system permease protein